MAITSEEIQAILGEIEEARAGRRLEKPKVVAREGEVIRDADPQVSKADPNYPASTEGVVKVRRSQFVKINMEAWERQMAEKAAARRERRELDPYGLGIWGWTPPVSEDER